MTPVIGIDFDNTLVSYDVLIHGAALDRGLIPPGTEVAKRAVRDRVRLGPDGEIEWQKLQALAYGPLMPRAQLIEGASEFVCTCHERRLRIYIVSHKTDYAGYDETGTNLRAAALDWMTARRFFVPDGLGLRRQDVYFEETRDAKIARIQSLGCTHFIDDLEEVLLEATFPAGVEKLLYAPDAIPTPVGDVRVMPSWQAIGDYFFGARP